MKFGDAIYTVRKQKNMSQDKFSKLIGVDQSYLSLLENNKKRPSTKLLEEISNSINIPLPILLFYSISEEDVKNDKRELFRLVYPQIKDMLFQIFDEGGDVDR
ncbi:helix-turn-helix transcriptional regulator [Balneolaceae bacterium YR4-1]|uniref:Helix-turn-helix transcriptional regulator n=1 Tax=Halalkalibaculum roseum TaxID=2709311 RepID=A0A6M1SYI6_9BACT|nr:helix-turn-helix transcriptional regulator [Halalkalibaculum roseum]NGP75627.1 helix-turn-helix transcriptional regulator [Halalkalibaculum roseum]